MEQGQLARAEIVNLETDEPVRCMFNPKEYTFSKQNKWNEKPAKGKEVGRLEFEGGSPARLKLQLLFDTYEMDAGGGKKKDVRDLTRGLWDMMKVSEKNKNSRTGKGEPPRCKFKWGDLWSFEAVIDSLSQKFTLFWHDGTPVRALVDVSFRQIRDEGQYPPQNPTSGGNPGDHLHTVREGETLAGIAYAELGDPTVWRHIAERNALDDPRRLQPGQVLVITPLPLM